MISPFANGCCQHILSAGVIFATPGLAQSSSDSVKYRLSQIHTGSRRIGAPHGKAQTHTWGINYFSHPCKTGGIKITLRGGSWYYKRTIRTGLALELPASLSQLANSSCLSGKVELLIEWLCSLLAPDGDSRALTSILSYNIFSIIIKLNKRYPRPSEIRAVVWSNRCWYSCWPAYGSKLPSGLAPTDC